jgi:SAM-dependent methyltransferase
MFEELLLAPWPRIGTLLTSSAQQPMSDFYDDLAPLYHLIFADWDASIQRQGQQLAALIRSRWPGHRSVLDVSCGIGTQAIALAMDGFEVRASDLSANAIERARIEASQRGQAIHFSVCDMRQASAHHGGGFDLVISCDNSLPHLLDDTQIGVALRAMHACLRPGGGCLLTVRDYDAEARRLNIVKPYGARIENGKRHVGLQVWDFDGEQYDLTLFLIEEDLATSAVTTRTMRSRYYAIGTGRLLALMTQAGFSDVCRLDGVFYQPVLVGTRAA